jgi:hypothetical protein
MALSAELLPAVLLACGVRRQGAAELDIGPILLREEHWAIVDPKGKAGHRRTIPMPLRCLIFRVDYPLPTLRTNPSSLHSSEPTPLWTKNNPVGSYFFFTADRRA